MTDQQTVDHVGPSLSSSWNSFRKETTCHGVNRISFIKGNMRQNIKSVLWVSFLLGSVGGLLSLFIELTQEFYNYPMYSRTTIHHVDKIQFPAVTICNLSTRNKSRLSDPARDRFWRDVVSNVNWSDPAYQHVSYHTPRTVEDIMDESMTFKDMFVYGVFNGERINETDITPVITRHGLCYTWNNDGRKWTSVSGTLLNLRFWININIQHYSFGFDSSSGVRIALHEPNKTPDVVSSGFVIQNGVEAYISLFPIKVKYPPYPYKAYGDEYCQKADIQSEIYPGKSVVYDPVLCEDWCLAKQALTQCGCKDVSEPGNETNCSLYELSTCYYVKLTSIYKIPSLCRCPRPCEYTRYNKEISYGQYPTDIVNEWSVQSNFTTQYDVDHKNNLQLRIYFEQLAFTEIERVPKYNTYSDILSDVGGQLGVFLGASFMTLTECGEFLLQCLLLICKSCLKRGKVDRKTKCETR